MIGEGSYPDGDRNGPEEGILVRYTHTPDGVSELLGPPRGVLQGGIGQHQDELLAAVSAGDVLLSQAPLQQSAKLDQDRVPGIVAERVILLLEAIHVHHEHPQGVPGSPSPVYLTVERLRHVSPVEQPGERIVDGLAAQDLAELHVGEAQTKLGRHRLREALLALTQGGLAIARLARHVEHPERVALGDERRADIRQGRRAGEVLAQHARTRILDDMGPTVA